MGCKDCKDLRAEQEEVKLGVAADRILMETTKGYRTIIKVLLGILTVFVLAFSVMAGCVVYNTSHTQTIVNEAITNAQDQFNEALLEALNTVAEIGVTSETVTNTTTQKL